MRFTCWHGKKNRKVDLVAGAVGQAVRFEAKYRAQQAGLRDLQDLLEFCTQKSVDRGCRVNKSPGGSGIIADLRYPTP